MASKAKSPFRLTMLTNEIAANSTSKVIEDILFYNEEDKLRISEDPKYKAEPVNIILNSGGGSVYDGFALIDVIDRSTTPVHITGYGSIMSMALLILVSGHKRFSGRFTTFMYHEISYDIPTETIQYHKQELQESDRAQKMYNEYLLSRTKFTKELTDDVISRRANYYFDANKAKELGIIHKVL